MNVAVLTLTRDRLAYTKHCFATLRAYAGCRFDHYVLDQGSTDGTHEWLFRTPGLNIVSMPENIGIHRGMNLLLNTINLDAYDVVVKIDNDCELMQEGTLLHLAQVAQLGVLCSPVVRGLTRELDIENPVMLGGIFLAAPATLYREDGFRFDETAPVWGTDDSTVSEWWRQRDRPMMYLRRWQVNHYETTVGQHARYPEYFERKRTEGLPAW